jgi:2-amino-4-hydroxy-6-hydroxymethyldihydropteridine diphosphokinase
MSGINTTAYVALGGNIGDTQKVFTEALNLIGSNSSISQLRISKWYRTAPVSSIPQDPYLNAVCHFDTTYNALELCSFLQEVERKLGKVPKIRDAPRILDLDILFFGGEIWQGTTLMIPHPRWKERLFILIPLKDLVKNIFLPQEDGSVKNYNLLEMIQELGKPEMIEELCMTYK